MNKESNSSSVYHFFARLIERRGYFGQDNKLEDFDFPMYMVAASSSYGFPDFVLRSNQDSALAGGEFIELKDAKSYQISSFNSTLPTARKHIDSLAKNVKSQLIESGENIERAPIRDVFYLVRGIKRTKNFPLAKTILVSGDFFETRPIESVLTEAFQQVALASTGSDVEIGDLLKGFEVKQSNFASSRSVPNSSITIRFRVMAEVHAKANLMREQEYPQITDNTLTLLVTEPNLDCNPPIEELYEWNKAPKSIQYCRSFLALKQAFNEINAHLQHLTRVSVLRHPFGGTYFLAQTHIGFDSSLKDSV